MIQPFKVNVPKEVLTDLKRRISATLWTDAVDGHEWQSGVSFPYLKALARYWVDSFDWRKTEEKINLFSSQVRAPQTRSSAFSL